MKKISFCYLLHNKIIDKENELFLIIITIKLILLHSYFKYMITI